jgi:hypothetical protein
VILPRQRPKARSFNFIDDPHLPEKRQHGRGAIVRHEGRMKRFASVNLSTLVILLLLALRSSDDLLGARPF